MWNSSLKARFIIEFLLNSLRQPDLGNEVNYNAFRQRLLSLTEKPYEHLHGGTFFDCNQNTRPDRIPAECSYAKQGPKFVHLKKRKREEFTEDDIGAIEVTNDGVLAAIYVTTAHGNAN